jgi:hypothetical protein
MTIDQSALGVVAAELMDLLADTYGEDATIERVAIIVAVDHGDQESVHYKFTSGTKHYAAKGLLRDVLEHME